VSRGIVVSGAVVQLSEMRVGWELGGSGTSSWVMECFPSCGPSVASPTRTFISPAFKSRWLEKQLSCREHSYHPTAADADRIYTYFPYGSALARHSRKMAMSKWFHGHLISARIGCELNVIWVSSRKAAIASWF